MRVKEFNAGIELENELNEWLKKNKSEIEVIDIKYSVASFSQSRDYDSEYFGCALLLYKFK